MPLCRKIMLGAEIRSGGDSCPVHETMLNEAGIRANPRVYSIS